MSHPNKNLEVKLWQESTPCWWAMKNCAYVVLSWGRVGNAIVSNSEKPPAMGQNPQWGQKSSCVVTDKASLSLSPCDADHTAAAKASELSL